MKITHLLAAATMIAGLGMSTAASAQDYRHDNRYEHRGDRREYRGNDHGHYGWNHHPRRCHSEFRHHRRVTVCYR